MNTRPTRRVFKHLPRGPASVIAMKQTCVCSLFLHILPYSNHIRTENAAKTFLTLDFSKQNGVGCVLSNAITSSQRHNRTQRFRERKHLRNDQSGPQRFPYNVMQMMQGSFKVFSSSDPYSYST